MTNPPQPAPNYPDPILDAVNDVGQKTVGAGTAAAMGAAGLAAARAAREEQEAAARREREQAEAAVVKVLGAQTAAAMRQARVLDTLVTHLVHTSRTLGVHPEHALRQAVSIEIDHDIRARVAALTSCLGWLANPGQAPDWAQDAVNRARQSGRPAAGGQVPAEVIVHGAAAAVFGREVADAMWRDGGIHRLTPHLTHTAQTLQVSPAEALRRAAGIYHLTGNARDDAGIMAARLGWLADPSQTPDWARNAVDQARDAMTKAASQARQATEATEQRRTPDPTSNPAFPEPASPTRRPPPAPQAEERLDAAYAALRHRFADTLWKPGFAVTPGGEAIPDPDIPPALARQLHRAATAVGLDPSTTLKCAVDMLDEPFRTLHNPIAVLDASLRWIANPATATPETRDRAAQVLAAHGGSLLPVPDERNSKASRSHHAAGSQDYADYLEDLSGRHEQGAATSRHQARPTGEAQHTAAGRAARHHRHAAKDKRTLAETIRGAFPGKAAAASPTRTPTALPPTHATPPAPTRQTRPLR